MYDKEINKLKQVVGENLWNLLAEQGCYIAGGALTSVFSNQPINDVDVYFPNEEAFTKVMQIIFDVDNLRSDYDMDYKDAMVNHVSGKAVLLLNENQQKIQLIAHKFYPYGTNIFDDFDFTINMAMVYMKDGFFACDVNFFKHLAQRYLHVNTDTSYPLISVMRVDKYRKRGYNISKAQMLRLLLAVNRKNIDSWQKLADELGGMYGTMPEEIFDYNSPFSLDEAIQKLDGFDIKDTIRINHPQYDDVIKTMPWAFTKEAKDKLLEEVKKDLNRYIGYHYSDYYQETISKLQKTIDMLEKFT